MVCQGTGRGASSRLAWEMVGSPAPLALGGGGGEEKVGIRVMEFLARGA